MALATNSFPVPVAPEIITGVEREAIQAIERSIGAPRAPFSISSAKFLRPARPGDRVVIEFSRSGGEVSFSCAVEGRIVLTGQMSCPDPSTDA